MEMSELKIDISLPSEGVRLLRLSGPFDISNLFVFQEQVRQNPHPVTIIDLSEVPYIDSAALGSLLGFHVSCQRGAARYALVEVSPRIQSLLRMSHVDTILIQHATLADAQRSLTGKSAAGPG